MKPPSAAKPAQSRLFLGVLVPKDTQATLAPIQDKLKGYKGWKTIPAHMLHITLHFLGAMPKAQSDTLRQQCRELAAATPCFEVSLGGTGYFPASGSPRVWFVKAESEALKALAAQLQQAFVVDKPEPFKPHLTLARKKSPAPRIGSLVVDTQFEVQEFCLIASELNPKGAQYTIIERFKLGALHGKS